MALATLPPYIKPFQEAGIKVIPVVPSLKLAKRIQDAGADAIVVEGMEAGGHIGSQNDNVFDGKHSTRNHYSCCCGWFHR